MNLSPQQNERLLQSLESLANSVKLLNRAFEKLAGPLAVAAMVIQEAGRADGLLDDSDDESHGSRDEDG